MGILKCLACDVWIRIVCAVLWDQIIGMGEEYLNMTMWLAAHQKIKCYKSYSISWTNFVKCFVKHSSKIAHA